MSQAAARAALLSAIVVSAAAILLIAPAGAAEGFAAEGDIVGANPGASLQGGATENEFAGSCSAEPASQGADGYVVELPEGFVGDGMTATVTGDSAGPYDLDLVFYDVDCSFIEQSATEAADETAPVAPTTRFIVVNQSLGADTHFCLVVGDAECPGGGASPSGSSTARSTA